MHKAFHCGIILNTKDWKIYKQSSAGTGQIAMGHNEVPCVSKGMKAFLNTLLWCELQAMLL